MYHDVDVGCCGPAVNSIRPSHMHPMFVEATIQKNSPKDEDNKTQRTEILREKVDDDDGRELEAVPLWPWVDFLMTRYVRNGLVFP